MSERERWIIYPLLFLALGASLRDKIFDRTMSKSILCQELTVVDDSQGPQQPLQILARISAAERPEPGAPMVAKMSVHGQMFVEELRVRSIVADNYFYRGIPFTPLQLSVPVPPPAQPRRTLEKEEKKDL